MNQTLYDLMDWASIEAVIYSEEDDPCNVLGPSVTAEGILIQSFDPCAVRMTVLVSGREYEMEKVEEGFFAALLKRKTIPSYLLKSIRENGETKVFKDAYAFAPLLGPEDTTLINEGVCYDIDRKMGAHPMTVNGTEGVHFAVWAPNAVRVSIVGEFNGWDGRLLPMQRLGTSGIFALFVPGLQTGSVYKYEIKAKGGSVFLKADPYANAAQLRPENGSVVTDLSVYHWSDSEWMKSRPTDVSSCPMAVYQVHLGSYLRREDHSFCTYQELAKAILAHVLACGYTHVELLPVMEHPLDETYGFQTGGFYAPTARFGNPTDFMAFVDLFHQNGIGVIADWSVSQFPSDDFSLGCFDGTCLYEHLDPRQGIHPVYGTRLFNYARPEVRNFLIGSALFWAGTYHIDGLRLDSVSSMLYLNYGRRDGQWIANRRGGNENLDAVEFFRDLNTVMKEEYPGCLMIAEENTGYPLVTGNVADGGLGFDLKWDNGWMEDFLEYIQLDPIFRGPHHSKLIFSMQYHYSEKFLLALCHSQMTEGKGSMFAKMPGKTAGKMANLKASFGYWITHPGKKLLFMGQDFAQKREWNANDSLSWDEAEKPENMLLTACLKDMLKLYRQKKALYCLDDDPSGFEWINDFSANENMLVFLRKGETKEETLLVVLNFSALTYEKRKIGVPWPGKYKEIFNTDHVRYGGKGHTNPRVKNARKDECDDREWSIRITVPPLGMSVFSCTPSEQEN